VWPSISPSPAGTKVVGVAFETLTRANSIGYIIPVPVIQHLLVYGVAVVLQWCHCGVTVVLQWCHSGVLRGCHSGVTVVLQWCHSVTWVNSIGYIIPVPVIQHLLVRVTPL
jgi:hypothetical protein